MGAVVTGLPRNSGLSRRVLALGVLAAATAAQARTAPCAPPRVLFVCPAGTVKSAIARETLRRRAAAAKVSVHVESRGLHPEDHVSAGLAANLRADGVDPAAEPVRTFSEADLGGADIVVAFDEAAQAPALWKARVWDIPSWNDHYEQAKAVLATHVDELIAELRNRQSQVCAGAKR
jgi:protein-tyrosine-phosphatase